MGLAFGLSVAFGIVILGIARVAVARARRWRALFERARLASRRKSEFLEVMSHEIRTPMNAVLGLAGLLKQSALNAEQMLLARTIESSTEALLPVLEQILDHHQIESGTLKLRDVDFAVGDVVRDVVELYRHVAATKHLELQLHVGHTVPARVSGDPTRLRQVVVNLIGNALRFTDRGFVRVNVRRFGDPGDQSPFTIGIDVRDSGHGIAVASQARFFAKFKAAPTVQRTHAGVKSGFGLKISRELVERMGGELAVESVLGQGTRVHFTVKLNAAHAPGSAGGPHALPKLRGHVLLVDDLALNRLVVAKVLESLGITYAAVGGGLEAVEAVAKNKFDLILMDCHMRPVDGYTATAMIRARTSAAPVPILALSAGGVEDDRARALAAGMDEFLTKPIALAQLHSVLSRYLPPQAGVLEVQVNSHNAAAEFDISALKQLESLEVDGRPLIDVLKEDYWGSADGELRKIQAAYASGDVHAASEAAHALKSASRTVGLLKIGSLCQQIEEQSLLDALARERLRDLEVALTRGVEWLKNVSLSA